MTKARLTRSILALAAVLVVLATGMSATDAGAKAPQPTSVGSAARKAPAAPGPAASHARRKGSAPVKSVPVKSAAAKLVLVPPQSPRPVLAKPPPGKGRRLENWGGARARRPRGRGRLS